MRLGIMQPYFFPYIGYYSLMNNTDEWIVFDTVQYIERGWMNRNRIIHPNKPEDLYISIPLQGHARDILIKDVVVSKNADYKEKIMAQLYASYKKRAKYFNETCAVVEKVLSIESDKLVDINVASLVQVAEYIGFEFKYQIFSKMDIEIEPVHDAGEWALNISKGVDADVYVNPPGGIDLFDSNKFASVGIGLEFLKANLTPYSQKKPRFFEGLSIIDVMMFNSPEQIRDMLQDYEIIYK